MTKPKPEDVKLTTITIDGNYGHPIYILRVCPDCKTAFHRFMENKDLTTYVTREKSSV